MPKTKPILWLAVLSILCVEPAGAATFSYEPFSDNEDGQLVDGFQWDPKLSQSTITQILLYLGQEGSSTYDVSLGYRATDLSEGQTVNSVRLRLNEQGSVITNGLVVSISAALDLDPFSVVGSARFALPRTTANVVWSIPAAWDSSGQRIAKYEETPNLAPIINEVIAQPGWDAGTKDIALFLELSSSFGDNVVRFDDTHSAYWNGGNAGLRAPRLRIHESYRDAFHGKEILCRPKPNSTHVNVIPHANTDAFVEWGTDGVGFPNTTTTVYIPAGAVYEFAMSGLLPDSEYFYRLNVRPAGGGAFQPGPVRSFLTLPASGQTARVCVTTDIHVTNQLALGLSTQMDLLETMLAFMPGYPAPERYHVWIDLGDLVVQRAQRPAFDLEETEQRYRTAREYVDQAAHSLPFVFVRGNHEEVNGWDYDGSAQNTMVWSGKMLLKYFSPPTPDGFFSGNPTSYPNVGIPGNYFAFDVGNLRIHALDPYLFSLTRPHNGHGETGGSMNGWDWTLGTPQYLWLHDDFVSNPAPFNLVAMHHLTTCYDDPGAFYGRGGIEVTKFSVDGRPTFEWGGEDSTGTYLLPTQRPDFVYGAPHDMLVALGNQVVLKGHEHFHARQELDGMIYLTLAKPDDTGEHTGELWGWRSVTYYPEALTLEESNSGFYSIVVDDTTATYSYVQTYPSAGIGTVRDSFTLLPGAATGASERLGDAPSRTSIRTVFPNPSRGDPVRIQWEIGRPGDVRLAIHDAAGRLVRDLESASYRPGRHETRWDARDRNGRPVASGIYFAKLVADGRVDAVKTLVIR